MPGNNSSGAVNGRTDDSLIGRTVGDHYTIEALLADRAKGKVYRATHRTLHHTVILKLTPVPWHSDVEARGRFEQDAKSLAGMEHDNITTVHDFGLDDRGIYLAEELVEGEMLSAYLERRGGLPLSEFVPIAAQVLKGMGAAHARGLLHCDLKPHNIFLCEHQGRANFVKICDLGMLQIIGGGAVDSKITAGTPGYMAPEQITDQQIDARADVYTIGVLFYLMLSGRLPYEGESATNLLYKQVNERPTPLDKVLPAGHDVPEGIMTLVHDCLARNPDERPIDANEIVEHLIDSVPAALFRLPKAGTIPVVTGAIDPSSQASAPQPRPQLEHSRPAIAPLSAPAPQTVSSDAAMVHEAVAAVGQEEESKSSGGWFIALLALVAVAVGVYFYMQGQFPGITPHQPQTPVAKSPTKQVGNGPEVAASPVDQWMQAASGHEARREYQQAAGLYRKVLAEQPDHVVAQTGLARVEAALATPQAVTDSSVAATDGETSDDSADETTGEDPDETTEADDTEGESADTSTSTPPDSAADLISVEVIATAEGDETVVVYADKKRMGKAPIVLELPPGKHKIELKAKGHRNVKRDLNLKPGKKIKPLEIKLKARQASVNHNVDIDPEEGPATVITVER